MTRIEIATEIRQIALFSARLGGDHVTRGLELSHRADLLERGEIDTVVFGERTWTV